MGNFELDVIIYMGEISVQKMSLLSANRACQSLFTYMVGHRFGHGNASKLVIFTCGDSENQQAQHGDIPLF